MANVDFPSGLSPVRNRNGNAPGITVMDCVTTVLYEGALAFMSTTGLVGLNLSSVLSAVQAKKIVGVFANSKAAGAVGADGSISKIRVYSDPDQEYIGQFDDATAGAITSSIGRIFPVVGVAAGNSTTLRSIMELDASAGGVVSVVTSVNCSLLQVLAVSKEIGNDLNSANARVICKLVPQAHMHRNGLAI